MDLDDSEMDSSGLDSMEQDSSEAQSTGSEPPDPVWRWSGYNKLIVMRSRTFDDGQDYDLLLDRLRIKMRYAPSEKLLLVVEDDIELRTGSYLETRQFGAEVSETRAQYWNGNAVLGEAKGDYRLENKLFRAYLKASLGPVDLTLGRQRIPIGTGRIWSTMDMLNPVNPVQVEREEYVGADVASLEWRTGGHQRMQAVYAPDPSKRDDRWMFRWMTHRNASDIDLVAASYWGDRLVGASIASQWGGAGIRGEYTWTDARIGRDYSRVLVGIDQAFANTFTVSVEAYFSSQSKRDLRAQLLADPLRRRTQPVARSYLGVSAGYEFTPLMKGGIHLLGNMDDGSRFVAPTFTWSLTENLALLLGAQFFSGKASSEYGRGQDLYHAQLQRFF